MGSLAELNPDELAIVHREDNFTTAKFSLNPTR